MFRLSMHVLQTTMPTVRVACGAGTSVYCRKFCGGSDTGTCKDTACDNTVVNTAGVYDTSDFAGLYLYTCKWILHMDRYVINYTGYKVHFIIYITLFFSLRYCRNYLQCTTAGQCDDNQC